MTDATVLDLVLLIIVIILAVGLLTGVVVARRLYRDVNRAGKAITDLHAALEQRSHERDTRLETIASALLEQSRSLHSLVSGLETRLDGLGVPPESQEARVIPTVDETGELQRLKVFLAGGVDLHVNRLGIDEAPDVYRVKQKPKSLIFSRVNVPYYHYYTADRQLNLNDPWNEPFGEIATRIIRSGTTHLLHDRLFTLWQGVKTVAASAAPIVEVGVWRGGSSRFLAEARRHFAKPGRIYCCDTFTGPVQVTPDVDGERKATQFTDVYEDARELLAGYPDVEIIRGDIEATAVQIPDATFAMLHVDVNVHRATAFVLERFGARVEPGGVIVVDDYGSVTCPGVKLSVDEFAAANPRFRLFHLLTGQAVLFSMAASSAQVVGSAPGTMVAPLP